MDIQIQISLSLSIYIYRDIDVDVDVDVDVDEDIEQAEDLVQRAGERARRGLDGVWSGMGAKHAGDQGT